MKKIVLIIGLLFVAACAEQAPQQEMAQETDIHNFELDEITVAELNQAYENGTYTAQQVTQLYIVYFYQILYIPHN